MNFAPSSGPVGTVVTINGSGFTGANQAWIGNARNVAVTVVSSTQLKVTIPAGATSGAIGIFNPTYAAFSATAFTLAGEPLAAVAPTTPVDAGTPGEPDTGGGAFDPCITCRRGEQQDTCAGDADGPVRRRRGQGEARDRVDRQYQGQDQALHQVEAVADLA